MLFRTMYFSYCSSSSSKCYDNTKMSPEAPPIVCLHPGVQPRPVSPSLKFRNKQYMRARMFFCRNCPIYYR